MPENDFGPLVNWHQTHDAPYGRSIYGSIRYVSVDFFGEDPNPAGQFQCLIPNCTHMFPM